MKTIAKWMRWRTKHSVMLREEATEIAQPLDLAWSTIKSDAIEVVPAPMREEATEIAQPHDRAWTNRMATIRVPAPRLELGTP